MSEARFFRQSLIVAVGLIALASAAAQVPAAHAEPAAVTFTVNSLLDQPDDLTTPGTCHTAANTCTLRAAIMQANRSSGVGVTIIVPAGTYVLTIPAVTGANGESNGDLNLTAPSGAGTVIDIVGAGAALTIVDGNQLDRIFRVHGLRTASISGMTIRNGYAAPLTTPGSIRLGGGIYNQGTLTLTGVVIRDNAAVEEGGGLCNDGSLTITGSTIYRNKADDGAGIRTNKSLALVDSIVSENVANNIGGGILNNIDLTVRGSAISGNTARIAGGIYNSKNLIIVNSTISSNSATFDGGGIYNDGSVNIYSSSVVSNGADSDADPSGGSGAGVMNGVNLNAVLNLRNTLVAGNYLSGSPVYDDCKGTVYSYGRNLFGTIRAGCSVLNAGGGSWTNLNSLSLIGALQDNGGPTPTHALLLGSNAIDGGDPALGCVGPDSNVLNTDQRGAPRAAGLRCDIGAFESALHIDVDGNNKYDALTDGVLIVRYLAGFTGQALISNAIGSGASRNTPEAIALHLAGIRSQLDVDNNGVPDVGTDGLLILRYLFGLRGPALIQGAVGTSPGRSTAPLIETYIRTLLPALP